MIDKIQGNPDDNRTVLIGHGSFSTPNVHAFTNNNPSQTDVPEGYLITVNDTGAFFNSSARVGSTSRWDFGYSGGSSQAQVMILLHEFGHLLESKSGFKDDFGNQAARMYNDKLVKQHCGKTLNAAKKIP